MMNTYLDTPEHRTAKCLLP